MNSLKNLLAIFLLHALPGGVFAQRLTVASDNRIKTFVERYTDSLRIAQQALDMNNTSYNGDSTKLFIPKAKYAPLFLPPTYYGKIGERMLEAKKKKKTFHKISRQTLLPAPCFMCICIVPIWFKPPMTICIK